MELQGEKTIPAPIATTWAALNDPDVLKACIAGCESVERTGDDAFVAVVAVKVGPVSARFKGNLQMTNVQAPNSYTINFDGQGGVAGHGKGSADVMLTALADDQTTLKYVARAQVGGKLAQIGSRLVDAAAGKIAEDFFKAFEAHLLAAHAAPTAAGMAAAVPDAMAAGLAADATAAGMAADATAAGLAPGAVAGLATGASPAAAVAPPGDIRVEEPAPPPLAAPVPAGAAPPMAMRTGAAAPSGATTTAAASPPIVAPVAAVAVEPSSAAPAAAVAPPLAGSAVAGGPSLSGVGPADLPVETTPAASTAQRDGGAAGRPSAPAAASTTAAPATVASDVAPSGGKTLWWLVGIALVLLAVYLLEPLTGDTVTSTPRPMDSLDLQVLAQARDWCADGHPVWLVTVIETWGSAPRPPGALLALRGDGQVVGSVSGGCVEDDLIERVRHGERVGRPSLVSYGVSKEEAARFGLPCGGNLRLVQEPLADTAWIDEVLRRTAGHHLVARRLDLESGAVTVEDAARDAAFSFDGRVLRTLFGPRWRLLVIGAGQLSRVVAQMALALDFEVVCCDPRDEYGLTWDVPGTTFTRAMPDDVVIELRLDPHSAVVAVTHDPKLDDLVLLEALKSPAFYVGALGSRGNTAKRRERLAQFDLTATEIDRLHGPIGLDLGGKTPAEIAVAIVAEIVAVKNGVALVQKKQGSAMPIQQPADKPLSR